MISTLTVQESTKYAHLKREIIGNIKVGKAAWSAIRKDIAEIHDKKLYRDEFNTFDRFCREVVGLSSDRVSQLIAQDAVAEALPAHFADLVGKNERVSRELVKAPEPAREKVIESVVERGEPVTAKAIKAEVAKLPPAAKNGEHKPAIPLDATGYPLTKTATIYWKRRGEIQAVLDGISEIKSLLERVGEERDVLWEGLNHNGCDAMLSSLYRYVSEAKPYAVCPQCGGHPEIQPTKCPRCRGKAMISKLQFETGTSDKIKELRDAHAKSILSK